MIKKISLFFLLFLTLSVFGQTGKEIIDKNIEKSGGLRAWKLLNTVQLKGNVALSLTEEFPIEIHQARPNLTKTSIWVNNQKRTIEGYDGKNGYQMDYSQNKLVINPNYKSESFDNDFIDFENKGFKANYLGKELINGKEVHKVELVKNVNKTVYYFDVKTYMLIKEVKKDEILVYSDYRKVGDLLFPYRIEGNHLTDKSQYVMNFFDIKINKAFPKDNFKF